MRRFFIGQLALCLTAIGATAASASADWGVQPTPNPSGSPSAGLSGVSCPGATCLAVGAYGTNNGSQPLAELWDGTSWSLQSVEGRGGWTGALQSVACPSDSECVAVGTRVRRTAIRTLVEQWDGATWSIVASPNPGRTRPSYLTGVSCTSATACTAVGYYVSRRGTDRALIEVWNGSRWSIKRAASPSRSRQSELYGVSCVPVRTCVAVGRYTGLQGNSRTLAERSTGAGWVVLPTSGHPNPISRSLNAVSCTSATACMAVGDYVNPNGYSRTLAESWDGIRWTVSTIPDPGKFNFLQGVSCDGPSSCLAVGQYGGNHTRDKPLAERWDGLAWSVETAMPPTGQASGGLTGVVCPLTASCAAVGGYAERSGNDLTLAESGS